MSEMGKSSSRTCATLIKHGLCLPVIGQPCVGQLCENKHIVIMSLKELNTDFSKKTGSFGNFRSINRINWTSFGSYCCGNLYIPLLCLCVHIITAFALSVPQMKDTGAGPVFGDYE